ncbi:MAG: hypothetical protein J7L53_06305, partial [Deltaproteobacteria bacterium]|nr:hypothetical protein [Deltaproteobacteria bacterium]
ELIEEEKDLLRSCIKGGRLRVFLWEEDSSNIPDSEELRLVILKKKDRDKMKNILENKGQTPRV